MQVFDLHSKKQLCHKALVIGYGVTGKAVVDFLINHTTIEVFVGNNGPVSLWQGELSDRIDYFDLSDTESLKKYADECDFIMRSPGVDPRKFANLALWEKEVGEIELAYQYLVANTEKENFPKIIAITGTNGKTTTVSLLDYALKKAKINSFLGGNVGTPFIQLFENKSWRKTEAIVLELSSFQTEQLDTFFANSVAILNLTPSHEERYDRVEDYYQAKINLISHVDIKNFFYLNSNTELIQDLNPKTQLIAENGLGLKEKIEKVQALKESLDLIGDHNLINALFCFCLIEAAGLEVSSSDFAGFYGVTYRLQKLQVPSNRIIYNDAKSTNQDASLIALSSMQINYPQFHFIMGGQLRDKTIDFTRLFSEIKNSAKLHFFGESKDELIRHAKKFQLSCSTYEKLDEVIKVLEEDDLPVLFSPGFPSFDQYKNYVKRGEHFSLLAETL